MLGALVGAALLDGASRRRAGGRGEEDPGRSGGPRGGRGGWRGSVLAEYSLSSEEGAALLGLAEAYLRVPDAATADALIRDKLARGDWKAHIGARPIASW